MRHDHSHVAPCLVPHREGWLYTVHVAYVFAKNGCLTAKWIERSPAGGEKYTPVNPSVGLY